MNYSSHIALLGILFLGAGSSPIRAGEPKAIVEGKFDDPLDAGWSWLREEPNGWKIEGGALRIQALPGYIFAKHNDARNVLLRKLPESTKPLAVEVFVENGPKVQFEHAGLYWYLDDDNYVCLLKEQTGKEVQVRMIREKGGAATFPFEKKYEAEGVWFRLVIGGGKATGYYRESPKEDWRKMGQADLPAKGEAQFGLNAAGGSKATDRWANFRDFRILEHAE